MTINTYMKYYDKYEEEIINFERKVDINEKQAKAEQLICEIHDIIVNGKDIDEKIFFYTVIINSGLLEYDTSILNEFVEWIMDTEIPAEEQMFLHRQINHTIFITLYVQNEENKIMMWKWYRKILEMWKKEISFHPGYVPYDNRNHDLYVVITDQIIAFQHGPTKTALARCKAIITKLCKKVLLINTAECLSISGRKCIFRAVVGSYMEEYLTKEEIQWENTKIPFVSCEKDSTYPYIMELWMKAIYDLKPECVIDISGESMLGNLCADFIPVVAIGLSPSELASSFETYQAVAKELGEKECRILKEIGINEDSIIKCVFTSNLRKQDTTYTKDELMIDETKFQIVIVGVRLNDEMTREFIDMLEQLDSEQYQIHICGLYTNCSDFNQSFYEKCCVNHGMVLDILSFMEHMDIYINPTRIGGGTSSVEAMDKGVPVLTVRRGDVYTNAGEEFGVENYEEMLKLIEKYRIDKDFYHKMSERAKERATYLQDTDGIFTELLNEVRTREIEKN